MLSKVRIELSGTEPCNWLMIASINDVVSVLYPDTTSQLFTFGSDSSLSTIDNGTNSATTAPRDSDTGFEEVLRALTGTSTKRFTS